MSLSVLLLAAAFCPIEVDEAALDRASLVDTEERLAVPYVGDFAVDGDVLKPVWRSAGALPPLAVERGKPLRTEVRVLYSSSALYVAATLWQPMDRLRAQFDQDDLAIYDDDNLEAFLQVPDGKNARFVHLAVNANGNVYDACDSRESYGLKGRIVKVRRLGDRWTVEMRLPYAGIPMDRPFAGDYIGIRFCRTVAEPAFVGSFPRLTMASHNRRADFARLAFSAADGGSGSVAREAAEYRAEVLRSRFYARYDALRARVDRLSAAVAGADGSVPALAEAFEGVRQMRQALKEFRLRNAKLLNGRQALPDGERASLLAVENGFNRFAAERAYLVWPMDVWAKGSPDDRPPSDYRAVTNIVFEQAGNEREAVGLYFQGLLCGPRLDLRIVPDSLVPRRDSRDRHEVPPETFEVYEEKFVRFDREIISEPLVKVEGGCVTLTPGVPTRVWIVFNSRGIRPGRHRATIALRPAWDGDVPERRLGVDATVWKFALPETRDWPLKSFFWGPNQYPNDEVDALRQMHSHHVTHGWTKGFLYWKGVSESGAVLGNGADDYDPELAKTANEPFFLAAKELGMRFVIGWSTPESVDWFKTMVARFRNMGFAYEDFVFKSLIADEFGKAAIPSRAARRQAVSQVPDSTNWWFQAVYLSTPPPSGATIEDIEAAGLPEFYKMWTLIGDLAGDPRRGPEVIRRLRAKGCSVWDYHCGQHMHSRTALGYYRNSPRIAYLNGLDGSAMWCTINPYGCDPRVTDGFTAADGEDDGILWMGRDRRLLSSKNFEAYCEGLEDVAYVDRLKKELARLKGRPFPDFQKLVKAYDEQCRHPSQTALDDWRLKVGRAIDGLVGIR